MRFPRGNRCAASTGEHWRAVLATSAMDEPATLGAGDSNSRTLSLPIADAVPAMPWRQVADQGRDWICRLLFARSAALAFTQGSGYWRFAMSW